MTDNPSEQTDMAGAAQEKEPPEKPAREIFPFSFERTKEDIFDFRPIPELVEGEPPRTADDAYVDKSVTEPSVEDDPLLDPKVSSAQEPVKSSDSPSPTSPVIPASVEKVSTLSKVGETGKQTS